MYKLPIFAMSKDKIGKKVKDAPTYLHILNTLSLKEWVPVVKEEENRSSIIWII